MTVIYICDICKKSKSEDKLSKMVWFSTMSAFQRDKNKEKYHVCNVCREQLKQLFSKK